jgi:hypothetical protein
MSLSSSMRFFILTGPRAPPSLHPHYRGFLTTMQDSDSCRCHPGLPLLRGYALCWASPLLRQPSRFIPTTLPKMPCPLTPPQRCTNSNGCSVRTCQHSSSGYGFGFAPPAFSMLVGWGSLSLWPPGSVDAPLAGLTSRSLPRHLFRS